MFAKMNNMIRKRGYMIKHGLTGSGVFSLSGVSIQRRPGCYKLFIFNFITSLLTAVWLCFFSIPVQAASITINTDILTLNGLAGGAEFRGTGFTTGFRSDGAAVFTFSGDLNLAGDTVNFTGSRAASFLVLNNADLSGTVFNLSASGAKSGGAGGGGGISGLPGTGGGGGGGGWGIL